MSTVSNAILEVIIIIAMTTDGDNNNNCLSIMCLLYTRHCTDHFISITPLYPNSDLMKQALLFFPISDTRKKRFEAFSVSPMFKQLVSVRMRI